MHFTVTFIKMVLGGIAFLIISQQFQPAFAQGVVCTAKSLEGLLHTDLDKQELDITFGRAMGGADINAYYLDENLTAVTT